MPEPTWIIMPILAHPEYTRAAIADCLAQSVPIRLLLVNQGVDEVFRDELEKIAEAESDRVLLWSHQPPLPSLAATWNHALDFAWATGAHAALVVNNDVRLHRQTCEVLQTALVATEALFISGVGVTPDQFDPLEVYPLIAADRLHTDRGGPDFSCFLISQVCHAQFQFDEHFTPAFCEDLDYHRRLMLVGEGARIFSVNLPFLHYGSATIKASPFRQAIELAIQEGSRTYYAKKWGGPVNQETFFSPFDKGVEGYSTAGMPNPPTTPALQAWVQGGGKPERLFEPNFIYPEEKADGQIP